MPSRAYDAVMNQFGPSDPPAAPDPQPEWTPSPAFQKTLESLSGSPFDVDPDKMGQPYDATRPLARTGARALATGAALAPAGAILNPEDPVKGAEDMATFGAVTGGAGEVAAPLLNRIGQPLVQRLARGGVEGGTMAGYTLATGGTPEEAASQGVIGAGFGALHEPTISDKNSGGPSGGRPLSPEYVGREAAPVIDNSQPEASTAAQPNIDAMLAEAETRRPSVSD